MTQTTTGVCRALKAYLDTILSGDFGDPDDINTDDNYMIGDTRQPTGRPTEAPTRSRERALEVDITITVWRAGNRKMQQVADEQAQRYAEQLEAFLRLTAPTLPINDVDSCRDSWVSNIHLERLAAYSIEDGDTVDVPSARVAVCTVTVTAMVRF